MGAHRDTQGSGFQELEAPFEAGGNKGSAQNLALSAMLSVIVIAYWGLCLGLPKYVRLPVRQGNHMD